MDKELYIEIVPAGLKVLAVPGWDGTCAPVPFYRLVYEMLAGALPEIPKIEIKKK
jgi:hypothetical protein